jgi:hypothetical protein
VKSENFLLLALTAQKFGCRPSSLAAFRDPVLALDFDLAAAARLLIAERGTQTEDDEAPSSELYW